ncbi:probable LRR receptor-like serine/threonine-protein kinase At2g16250 [Musa acuminata AAA Group]|uniref:probable LRR receptor-like serine/threonine-protein kinase At2g16250 n=1 Tax=Musa acuminata AAA Group TaxID=214697 RepID=UPI0031E2DB08
MKSPARLPLVCFFFFLRCFLDVPCSALPQTERNALLKLRASLAVRAKDWSLQADPCSSWTGVVCRTNRVEELNLTGLRPNRFARKGLVLPRLAPDAVLNLTHLTSLDASGFPLPGPIPDDLGNVSSLSVLSLAGTGASGRIPSKLGWLGHLTALDLSGNLLTGSIPVEFSGLHNLTHLDLSSNTLSGAVPPSLGELRQLNALNLSNNMLSGSLPAELGGLSSLVTLDLSFNWLSGSLPEDVLLRLPYLRSVKLGHNNFSSSLPTSLWTLAQLVHLDVSFNDLTGMLMVDAVARNSIAKGGVFNLSNNLFYGSISSESSRILQRFEVVDLSTNYFDGSEPVGFSDASVAFNCFSSARDQRKPADCETFYTERGLRLALSSGRRRKWRWWYAVVAVVCGVALLAVVIAVLVRYLTRCAARSAGQKDTGSKPAPEEEAAVSPSPPPSAADTVNLSASNGALTGTTLPLSVAAPVNPLSSDDGVTNTTPSPSAAVMVNLPAPGDAFTYEQLLRATSGFSSMNLIKNGHSGDLYHGVLEDGVEVVVKRIGLLAVRREAFSTELKLFEDCSGGRLVPLLGHCLENDTEKLLVYKYMPNCDLSTALHKKSELEDGLQSLDWIKRLKIAVGAVEALCFLHHDNNPPLVHRDIEASSILLDDKYEVRLGSLNEVCVQQIDVRQNVLTRIFRSAQTSRQVVSGLSTATSAYDIYCLGKVLLELITGKPGLSGSNNAATNKWMEQTQAYITPFDKELVSKIMDPSLIVDEDHMEEVWAMAVVAKSCLDPKPSKRPLARHVLKALENPLKVVREVNCSNSFTSSSGSWHSALLGGWRHSLSSISLVRPVEEDRMSSKQATTTRSHRGGDDHSFPQSKMSREIHPEPAGPAQDRS